ncbi:1-phosphofructokinase [Aliiruegeria lutimaris]|uniref:Phosphofructokinase n=1 Tax=Aliiruegeria lutimaris TaxID=571298 RepID=A0A1G9PUF0_9RHOB|nr:1-phosphofructokinase [Aliiruegeria lutimaris]SDM02283.1 fructose-1-phosphate kinase [Aliiruegeria lutimaris]
MAKLPRVATVTLNPALDQTAQSPDFHAGKVNRVISEQSDAGGKGVNVAAYLARYGHDVTATGLLGRGNLEPFENLFAERGIVDRFVKLPGLTRVNVKIVDKIRELVTDINFPGINADDDSIDAVTRIVFELADDGVKWFILSGSLPKGMQTDSYRLLIEQLKDKGCKVVLDTSGIPFDRALHAKPNVIKPSIDELQEVTGSVVESHGEIIAAARKILENGTELVVVSMRDKGALFVTAEQTVLAVPPKARVVSTVGAGDAMVAGITHGLITGMPLPKIARFSTALSLGALAQIGPNLPPKEDISAFEELVSISDPT